LVRDDNYLEIDELEDGDEVEFDPQVMVISRFDELLSKLDTIIQDSTERARADIARSQTQLEVLATLQALIRNNVTTKRPADLEPIQTVLTKLQEQQHAPRPAYEFDVTRDNRGFISKITAKPQGQPLH
jgi:hypothetical protein